MLKREADEMSGYRWWVQAVGSSPFPCFWSVTSVEGERPNLRWAIKDDDMKRRLDDAKSSAECPSLYQYHRSRRQIFFMTVWKFNSALISEQDDAPFSCLPSLYSSRLWIATSSLFALGTWAGHSVYAIFVFDWSSPETIQTSHGLLLRYALMLMKGLNTLGRTHMSFKLKRCSRNFGVWFRFNVQLRSEILGHYQPVLVGDMRFEIDTQRDLNARGTLLARELDSFVMKLWRTLGSDMSISGCWAIDQDINLVFTSLSNVPGPSWSVLAVLILLQNLLLLPWVDGEQSVLELLILPANLSMVSLWLTLRVSLAIEYGIDLIIFGCGSLYFLLLASDFWYVPVTYL